MSQLSGPPVQAPIVDTAGRVTHPWTMFFQTLKRLPVIVGSHLERINSYAAELQAPGTLFCEYDRTVFYARVDLSSPVMTAVNQDSAAAGSTLYVPSTQGFRVGQAVYIGQGTAREETNVISATTPNVSFTLVGPLANTHTAVQADRVTSSPRTSVDGNSASGTPTLNVASTMGFTAGQTVLIAPSTPRQERRMIQSVTAGVSFTLTENLAYTHTAAQADRLGLAPEWVYVFGTMRDAIANRPTDLGPNDDGFLFEDTTNGVLYRWDGATMAWVLTTTSFERVMIEKYNGDPRLEFYRSNGTVAVPTPAMQYDILANITARGFGATTYPTASLAGIIVEAAEDFDDTHGGTDMMIYTTPKLNVVQAEVMRLAANGCVGINDSTPTAKLDVGGTFRATGSINPLDGVGVEVRYDGGASIGSVLAYDRATSAYKVLRVNGLVLALNSDGPTGHVLVKTTIDNADGGALQVSGDLSPSTDNTGDLGTALCQWNDIRFKGTIVQNTTTCVDGSGNAVFTSYSVGATPGIDQVVALAKLTAGGADGTATFTKGILTAYTAPT